MGSCCSQPAAAQRYVVSADADVSPVDDRQRHRADESNAAADADILQNGVPSAALRSKQSRSLVPVGTGGPAVSAVAVDAENSAASAQFSRSGGGAAAQEPPKLAKETCKELDRKEHTLRAAVMTDEFKFREDLSVLEVWQRARLADVAKEKEASVAVTTGSDGSLLHTDESTHDEDDDLQQMALKGIVIEECIIAPAVFHTRSVLDRIASPSQCSPNSSTFSPLRVGRRSTTGREDAGEVTSYGSLLRSEQELLDDVLEYACRPPSPPFVAPLRLTYDPPPLDRSSRAPSPQTTAVEQQRRGVDAFSEGTTMEMLPFLALPSAVESRNHLRRSLIRELNAESARHEILYGLPVMCLDLDEVDNRDLVERYQQHEVSEIWLLATQEGAFRWKLHYGRFLLRRRLTEVMWALERFEAHARCNVDQEAFEVRCTCAAHANLQLVLRHAYECSIIEMNQREAEKHAREEAARAVESEKRRKVNKLKWEVARSRIKGDGLSAKEKLHRQLSAAVASAASAPLAAPQQAKSESRGGSTSSGSPSAGLSKKRLWFARAAERLNAEEARWRGALEVEVSRRWEQLMDEVIRLDCSLLAAPSLREVLTARQQVALIEAQQQLERIERRLHFEVLQKQLAAAHRDLEYLASAARLISLEERKSRDAAEYQEALFRAMLVDQHAEEHDIHATHERRRRAESEAVEREMEAQQYVLRCLQLLQRCGRARIVRQRLGLVYPVGEDVRFLVEEHRRLHKHILMMENIARGDLAHFCALESKLRFPEAPWRIVPDMELYLWTPSCLPTVEVLLREALVREWVKVSEDLLAPFEAKRVELAKVSPKIGLLRFHSAVRVQRAMRRALLRMHFKRDSYDALVIAREKRSACRSDLRFVRDTELLYRNRIMSEYLATDWKELRNACFAESRRHWSAAVAVQRVFRGWYARQKILPPLQEAYLRRKLLQLEARGRQRANP